MDVDSLIPTNNRKKNLKVLEIRLARNAALWIAGNMTDDEFFGKLERIEMFLNRPLLLISMELYKYYDKDGEVLPQYRNQIISMPYGG